MKTLPNVALGCVVVSLCACASLPPEKIHYRLPTTTMSVEVIRTLGCTKGNDVIEAFKVNPTVIQHADQSEDGDKFLDIGKLHGPFNDSDIRVEFYDDGRLKSVNGSTTGEGETILKSAAVMVGAMLATASKSFPAQDTSDICKAIQSAAADGKTLTVTYAGDITFDLANPKTTLHYSDESEFLNDDIKAQLGTITTLVGFATCPKTSSTSPDAKDGPAKPVVDFDTANPPSGGLIVEMRNPKWITVSVCSDRTRLRLWTDKVPVSQFGASYSAFFAKPVAFGKELLSMSVAESGALTSIQYTNTSGTASALNAAGAVVGEQQAIDTAQYNALKLKNDTIKEQKRAVLCQADDTKC